MKEWKFKEADSHQIESLTSTLKISPLVARLLVQRGLNDPGRAKEFLFNTLKDLPSPFLMKGMDLAVTRLVSAIRANEKILVYGDYDVDGTTASSLLVLFFRDIGYPIEFYIPNRMREGYSLNEAAIRTIAERGIRVLITVDNGIAAAREAKLAADLGIDLIITDHHEVPPQLPQALAVVNPHQKDCSFPSKEICGTGVAFYLLMGLRQRLREGAYFSNQIPEPNMRRYLDLVALATVADVVPLLNVNRIFVRVGLDQMAKTEWPGLKALLDVSDLGDEPILTSHLGFRLAPRLNACGRLYDASTGVRLLTSQSVDEAKKLAAELDSANGERREIEAGILKDALEILAADPHAKTRMSHVLYQPHWHAGVVGIVASRVMERTGRPTILLAQDGDRLKGSARTCGGLNLVGALKECESVLLKFGGHQAAAGLTLTPENLEPFRSAFEEAVQKKLAELDLAPSLSLDGELMLEEINLKLLDELGRMEPFGQGNPEPMFCVKQIASARTRIVGKNHLKFEVLKNKARAEAIAFGMAEEETNLTGSLDLAFVLMKNTYRGNETVVLNIRDIKSLK